MQPIQPLGAGRFDWIDRLRSIGDASQVPTTGVPGAGQTTPVNAGNSISALQISSSVSQMLSAIGSGVQKNQMLELMIALLILMAMTQQQEGAGASSGILKQLGNLGQSLSAPMVSYSSTHISTQVTSLTYTQLQIVGPQGGASENGNQPRVDTTA